MEKLEKIFLKIKEILLKRAIKKAAKEHFEDMEMFERIMKDIN